MGPGSMDFLKTTFTKLNAENYHLWKYKVELILKRQGAWECVSKAPPADPDDAWKKLDDEATVIIGLSVEDSQLMLIKKSKTAYESWEALRSHQEKNTLGSSVRLMRRICGMKFSMGSSITEHIMELKLLFEKLEALGEQFSERWLVAMLLSSLPSSFDTLVTALEARKVEELTLKVVEASLIDEYQRQSQQFSANNSALRSSASLEERNKKVCHHCKAKGHIKKDCWKLKKLRQNNHVNEAREDNVEQVINFCFSMANNKSILVVDSGATCHISSRESDFVTMDRSVFEKVIVANGESVVSSGKGLC